MTAPQGPIQIHFRDFGAEQMIPMAFPPNVSRDEIMTVACTMLEEGKAVEARVVDTRDGRTQWSGCWNLTTTLSRD